MAVDGDRIHPDKARRLTNQATANPPVRHPAAARAPSRPPPAPNQSLTYSSFLPLRFLLLGTLFLHPLQRHQHTNTRNSLPPRLLSSRKLRRKTLLYRKLTCATPPVLPLRSTYNSEALSLPAVAENTLNPFTKPISQGHPSTSEFMSIENLKTYGTFSLSRFFSITQKPWDRPEATKPQNPTRVYLHLLMPSHMLPTPPNPHVRTDVVYGNSFC